MNLEQEITDTRLQIEHDPTLRIQVMSRIDVVTYLQILEEAQSTDSCVSHVVRDACAEFFRLRECVKAGFAGTCNLNTKAVVENLATLLGLSTDDTIRYILDQAAFNVFSEAQKRRQELGQTGNPQQL